MDAHTTLVQPVLGTVLAASTGRLGASAAGALGLISLVVGGLAVARARSEGSGGTGPRGATVAMALGTVGVLGGGVVVATADGGVGTGNGLGGAVVAVVLGLIGIALGGLARFRSRVPSPA
ncbi:MAG TPA: DUF6223 family protein [Iamia sp.]